MRCAVILPTLNVVPFGQRRVREIRRLASIRFYRLEQFANFDMAGKAITPPPPTATPEKITVTATVQYAFKFSALRLPLKVCVPPITVVTRRYHSLTPASHQDGV